MDILTSETFDVAIAGAGPAGSAAGIRLARGGLRVLLVERSRFPREKLCGEFVSPECIRHFEDLGVSDLAASDYPRIERTVFFSQKGRSIEFMSDWFESGRTALGISRAEMDRRLLDAARESGAAVLTETTVVESQTTPGSAIQLKLKSTGQQSRSIEVPLVLDATGRKRSLGSGPSDGRKAEHVAFKTHLRGVAMADSSCEIYSYLGGYGGCNAVGADLYNLCFIVEAGLVRSLGSDAESVMRSVVFRNVRARRVLENACFDGEWLAVPVSGFGRRRATVSERIYFVGDSAAFIDPFTGSGILLALQSAEICADVILRGTRSGASYRAMAEEYERKYDSLLGTRLRISSLLRPASNSPRLADVILAVASRSERLRSALARATRFSAVPGA